MCAADELQNHRVRDRVSNRRDRTRTSAGASVHTRPRRPCGCSHLASSGGEIASQTSARAGSLTPAAPDYERLREVHRLPALPLGGVLQLLARLLHIGRLLLRGSFSLSMRVPGRLPGCRLALPLAASAVFLAWSRLLIRINFLLPRCRIQHQRTQVGFPGPERPNTRSRNLRMALTAIRTRPAPIVMAHLS